MNKPKQNDSLSLKGMSSYASPQNCVICPITHIHRHILEFYWQSLAYKDTLKYRLSDFEDPTWSDVVRVITRKDVVMFMVLLPGLNKEDGAFPVAEFALEGFTGKAAQIHFSMFPDNDYKTNRIVMDEALRQIDRLKSKDGSPYVETLVGLTPVDNRAARLMNQRAGFNTIGVIPRAVRYLNEVTDAVLTVRECNG